MHTIILKVQKKLNDGSKNAGAFSVSPIIKHQSWIYYSSAQQVKEKLFYCGIKAPTTQKQVNRASIQGNMISRFTFINN